MDADICMCVLNATIISPTYINGTYNNMVPSNARVVTFKYLIIPITIDLKETLSGPGLGGSKSATLRQKLWCSRPV